MRDSRECPKCGAEKPETEFRNDRRMCKSCQKSPEYKSWQAMRARVNNKNRWYWKNYGGRGISICARGESFAMFLADMGPKPTPEHTLDRIDTDGNYYPANCRWATRSEQQRNTRTSMRITLGGETMSAWDWSERTGIPLHVLRWRLEKGWSHEATLTVPVSRSNARRMRGGVPLASLRSELEKAGGG